MKVDNLLATYLYQFKKLLLPGIGIFTLDEKAVLGDDSAKIKTPIEGISFGPSKVLQLDDSLVQYVKDHTGKMKALAEADLYSFITIALQFLNIGKPFYIEGIGTLQKTKEGTYTFSAGTVIPQHAEEPLVKFSDTTKNITHDPKAAGNGANTGRLLVVAGILVTLGLIAWGGLYLYKKNTAGSNGAVEPASAVVTTDTTATSQKMDSSGHRPDSLAVKPNTTDSANPLVKDSATTGYRFILETTTKKARALKRYQQLKDASILGKYNNKVALETQDSSSFNIYTIVNCMPADTAKVKEQLNAWYYGNAAAKVRIQH